MELQTRFEVEIYEFVDLASQLARGREDALNKIEQLEEALQGAMKDLERQKIERLEEREQIQQKDRKFSDEKSTWSMEMEKLRAQNDELQAKCDSFQSEIQTLQVALSQQQTMSTSSGANVNLGTNRLSQIVNKEIIEEVSAIHENLKQLEARVNIVVTTAAQADHRAIETDKIIQAANGLLKKSSDELERRRNAHRDDMMKSRQDGATISSLRLDVESLNEQVNRYKEEVHQLSQQRRSVEAELERTKFVIATSLMPLLAKSETSGNENRIAIEEAVGEALQGMSTPSTSTAMIPVSSANAAHTTLTSLTTAYSTLATSVNTSTTMEAKAEVAPVMMLLTADADKKDDEEDLIDVPPLPTLVN